MTSWSLCMWQWPLAWQTKITFPKSWVSWYLKMYEDGRGESQAFNPKHLIYAETIFSVRYLSQWLSAVPTVESIFLKCPGRTPAGGTRFGGWTPDSGGRMPQEPAVSLQKKSDVFCEPLPPDMHRFGSTKRIWSKKRQKCLQGMLLHFFELMLRDGRPSRISPWNMRAQMQISYSAPHGSLACSTVKHISIQNAFGSFKHAIFMDFCCVSFSLIVHWKCFGTRCLHFTS